jgi:hypothetical protein
MGGFASKPGGAGAAGAAGSARSANKPATIEDFIARRNEQLRSLGLTPEEIASIIQEDIGLLQNVTTLHNINTLISRFYVDNMKAEDEATVPVGLLEGFSVDGLFRMNASGNNNDCLIHSFLTATCENFRRLEQNSKDEFANFFRRTVFLTLPAVQCFQANEPGLGQRMADRVMSRKFLEEQELRLLAAQFRVNILAATGESRRFQSVTSDALRDILPRPCVPAGAFEHTIAIYTSGVHFEALRDVEGYRFTQGKVGNLIRASEQAFNQRQDPELAAALAASMGKPVSPRSPRNKNLEAALAASLENLAGKSAKKPAKQPALNYNSLAKVMGISVAQLKRDYTNAQLIEFMSGGGKRRTRRRRRA